MIIWCLAAVLAGWGASALAGLDEDFKALATHEWGQSDAALRSIDKAVVAARNREPARKDLEMRLAQLLKATATRPAKCYACQKLALIGTKDCVPALAGMLADKDLSHMARYALEAIPDAAAAAVLRDAMPNLKDAAKVGVINSLGVRRDAASVAPLAASLGDADSQVVAAAASALARIGTAEAVRTLFAFRAKAPAAIRASVSVACVEAAQSLAQAGDKDEAAKRFEELIVPTEPVWVQMGAFRGLIAAQPEQAFQRVIKALQGDDALRRAVAGETIRAVNDPKPYADALGTLPPAAQVIVLNVLGQRGYVAARGAVVAALGSPDEAVRAAAMGALGHVGTVEDVPRLAAAAAKPGAAGDAARAALVRIKTPGANKAMVAAISQTAAARAAVVGALAARGAVDELPALVRCIEDPQPEVRSAALAAVAAIGRQQQAGDLVRLLRKTQVPNERAAVASALLSVCGRYGAACAPHVTPLAQSGDGGLRVIAIHALVSCGGESALAAVRSAIEDPEETVRDEAIRTLSSWPNKWPDDAGARDPLLALARSAKKASHQVLALRGYLQCVQNDKSLPSQEKAAELNKVLPLVTRAEEKRLAIATIGALSNAGALEMLARFAADPAVSEEACSAIVNLAERGDLKDVSNQQRRKALRTAAENSKADATKKRAEELLKAVP
jgi:HEAT repeat protein